MVPELPHVTREQIENLKGVLENDVSLYEEICTLIQCGLEDFVSGAEPQEVSEKIATCLLLIMKGAI